MPQELWGLSLWGHSELFFGCMASQFQENCAIFLWGYHARWCWHADFVWLSSKTQEEFKILGYLQSSDNLWLGPCMCPMCLLSSTHVLTNHSATFSLQYLRVVGIATDIIYPMCPSSLTSREITWLHQPVLQVAAAIFLRGSKIIAP